MSMVGPRPIRPAFFEELTEEVPQYWQRLVVRPGVTGFAQTRVRREETWADKLAHDLEYIADRSVSALRPGARRDRRADRPPRATEGLLPRRGRPELSGGPRVCGICGIARLDGSSAGSTATSSRRWRRRWSTAVRTARGSRSRGPWVSRRAGCRSLTSNTVTSRSPTRTGDVMVVQNGEIVNFRQLRAELESAGHRFRTDGDTEVLAHLYEQHGLDFAERLRGMFAIAIWDVRRRRLVLARDPFRDQAARPLERPGDARVRLRPARVATRAGIRRRDRSQRPSTPTWRSTACPAPMTILRGARKLPAGHLLVWEPGSPPRTSRFARPASGSPGRASRRGRGGARGGTARAPARLRPRSPGRRRAGRASCSRAGSTRERSQRSRPRRRAIRSRRSRSGSRSSRSTSSDGRGRSRRRYGTDHH